MKKRNVISVNKVKIHVFVDDNGIISAVKVNNDLFLKHFNETDEDFYNKRIIPVLWKKGINFSEIYTSDNVLVDNVKNCKIKEHVNINLSKYQISRILRSSSYNALEYDEKLYVDKLYYQVYGEKFNHFSNDWEYVKNIVNIAQYGDISKLKLKKESSSVNKKNTQLFDLESLPNPLFESDVVGKVLNVLKDDMYADIYNILTSYGYLDDFDQRSSINYDDLAVYENMRFKSSKKVQYKNADNWKRKLEIKRLPDKPFDANSLDKLDEYYEELYGDYLYHRFYKSMVNGHWKYLPSGENSIGNKITHRIYVNVPLDTLVKFVMEIHERLGKSNIKYDAKFSARVKRDDQMVIYTDEENYVKILNEINSIYREKPELFSNECQACMTTAKTGIPGVGIAHEPNFAYTSHNAHVETVIKRALSVAALQYILDSSDVEFKNKFLESFSVYCSDSFKNNLGSNFYDVMNTLIDNISVNAPDFEGNNQVVYSEFDTSILDSQLFSAVSKSISSCQDIQKLKLLTVSEIISNSELYHLNPDNIAFNRVQNEKNRTLRI